MFLFLSKFLPLLFYPLGIVCILLLISLFFRKQQRLQRASIIFALIVIFISSNRWVSLGLARSLEWQYLPPDDVPVTDVIVVLGGGTEANQYPRTGVEINGAGDRLLTAARLYHQGKASHILLSGGYIDWFDSRTSSPAFEMKEILKALGIPEEALWLETESQNTYENALYTRQILEQKNIKKIILVTSAMHMPRSVKLFEHQGFEVIPYSSDFSVTDVKWAELSTPDLIVQIFNLLPNSSNLSQTTSALKEYIGICIYSLKGWQ